jgi:RHS repeat-associated protein
MDISENFGSDNTLISSTSMRDASNAPLSGYDDINRPTHQRDSRTGVSETEYLSATADIVISVTDPGNRTTAFTHDHRGRQTAVDAPNTLDAEGVTLTNITTTSYFPDGTIKETDGEQTYRTTHTYDYAQRMKTLTTYGTETAVTEWKYSPDRGFLTEKNYQGETNNGPGNTADYTYTAAGRLLTRTWERGITTTYTHDPAGRLTITDHSDTTPDVLITYDTLNRPITVKNGEGAYISGAFTIATPLSTSTFAYDPATLATDTETVSHDIDLNGTPELTRVIDRSRDTLSRSTGWELKNGSVIENSVTYNYHLTDGRVDSISGGGLHPPSQFNYTYEPNSYGLIKTITSPIHTVTNNYEADRNVLQSKQNKVGTTNISTYQYGVNPLGQRTNVAQTGTAFGSVRDIIWGYNAKGEVTKADHTIPGLSRAYAFDGIGNRLKSAEGTTDPNDPTASLYTPTALNQYSAINNQSSIINPQFDPDGNMTHGPLPAAPGENSVLEWDAENRLIEVQVGTSGPLVRYLYDAQSRRIATVMPDGTAILTIYDGWNPIAEYSGNVGVSPTLTKTNLWGIDLSGSIQGAGGVGGLLMVSEITNSQISNYYPTYDGNGNISEYLDSSGAIAAHYEYDPFGRTTVATGSKANDFTHRFSTKPLDSATGLYYYGYRWYDPETGRWPSRDPIEEQGGVNLYGMVGNDVIDKYDYLGLVDPNSPGDRHHWFPQKFKDLFRDICGDSLDIDKFTTLMHGSTHSLIEDTFKYRKTMQEYLRTNPDCCDLLMFVKDLIEATLTYFIGSKHNWMDWSMEGNLPTADLRDFNIRGPGSKSVPTNNRAFDELIKKNCGDRRRSRRCPASDGYRERIREWRDMPGYENSKSISNPRSRPNPQQESDNEAIRRDEDFRRLWRINRELEKDLRERENARRNLAERDDLQRALRMRYPNTTVLLVPPLPPRLPQPANRR